MVTYQQGGKAKLHASSEAKLLPKRAGLCEIFKATPLASVRRAVLLFYINVWEKDANNVPASKLTDTELFKTLSWH